MHFVPHSIFPTFSGWDAISRLIFEVDGGGGKQIFPISPQFPPLKNSPSHSKQKTPHLKFFHGSNLEHFASDYSIISFYLQWNANLEYQVPIFPFSVFVKQPLFSQWAIASNPIFNPSSHSDAGETLEGANTVDIYKIQHFNLVQPCILLIMRRHMCQM